MKHFIAPPLQQMSFKGFVMIVGLLALSACTGKGGPSENVAAAQCRGIYYTSDAAGNLLKWNQFHTANNPTCLTENMPLSQWQTTSQKFVNGRVQCVPQTGFASMTLTSSNNYYAYRDGRILLDLDSSTGIYRRIEFGQEDDGSPTFSRNEGCFYWRTGSGVDVTFGTQLLLDSDVSQWASTDLFQPMEIFRVDTVDSIVSMTRFDSTSDWNYEFCPYMSVPGTYCVGLDDGNSMYYPALTDAQQADLLAEAILIRTQFNYVASSSSAFEVQWRSIDASLPETTSDAFDDMVVGNADVPDFVDQAWHDYVAGTRATMPDVTSNTLPDICYSGSESVTLTNGSAGRIFGEICYTDGVYSFTQD